MRVLHLINDLSAGGAQSGLFYLLKNSQSLPDFSSEVCVLHKAGIFGGELSEAGVKIHEFDETNRYSPSIAIKLNRLIQKGDYQIVHVHLFPGLYWGAILAWMFPHCRWIFTEHSTWNKRRGLSWAKGLEEWAYRQYDRIITISDSAKQSLLSWQPWLQDRISVIPNGVDLSRFDILDGHAKQTRVDFGIDEKTRLVIFAGRLVKEKGADILLEAVSLLRVHDIKVIIAGDGPEMPTLKALCSALKLDNVVTFLGVRSDIPELMAAADLVVLPSRWEGLPLSLLEAMASGKPVVACQVGGIEEVISDGKEGLLVPAENPQAMKSAIERVLNDPGLADSLGKAGKRRADEFSAKSVARQLHSLYVKLL